MAYTFDGPNKRIILDSATLDVRDLYSRWKEWVATGDNSKYLPAFSSVGGDPIDEANGVYITSYIFLMNGWKLRPQEADHTLKVSNGVLVTDDGSDPFVHTLGAFNVMVVYSQPVRTETVNTNIEGLLNFPDAVEPGWTPRQTMQVIAAILAGKVRDAETNNIKFRDLADSKDRVTATVDQDGNRTVIVYDKT